MIASLVGVENIGFGYGKKPIIKNLSWESRGGKTLLLGPNGAGKSTLLKLLVGLLQPEGGFITGHAGPAIGYMPQSIRPIPGLKVSEQVEYVAWLGGASSAKARDFAAHALELAQLVDQASSPAAQLSGGQRRRLGLAQALAGPRELLVLDEPAAGLDPAQRVSLNEVLAQLAVPMLVATHQIEDVQSIYDDVFVMQAGSKIFDDELRAFLALDETGERDPYRSYRRLMGSGGAP